MLKYISDSTASSGPHCKLWQAKFRDLFLLQNWSAIHSTWDHFVRSFGEWRPFRMQLISTGFVGAHYAGNLLWGHLSHKLLVPTSSLGTELTPSPCTSSHLQSAGTLKCYSFHRREEMAGKAVKTVNPPVLVFPLQLKTGDVLGSCRRHLSETFWKGNGNHIPEKKSTSAGLAD